LDGGNERQPAKPKANTDNAEPIRELRMSFHDTAQFAMRSKGIWRAFTVMQ
jgi:hypothetical protein